MLGLPNGAQEMAPEPGSINAILREHCRARLYVRAIGWTMDQPRLLGCRFVRRKLRSKPRRRKSCTEKMEEAKPTDADAAQLRKDRILLARRIPTTDRVPGPLGDMSGLLETFNIWQTQ